MQPGNPCEKMNSPEPSPDSGSSGIKKAIKAAPRARRAISRCCFVLGVVCTSRMLLASAARVRLDALGPAPRAELLHVLMLPDFERADRIGEFWGYPESRTFAELLIDCEEDRTLAGGAVGMLREAERGR